MAKERGNDADRQTDPDYFSPAESWKYYSKAAGSGAWCLCPHDLQGHQYPVGCRHPDPVAEGIQRRVVSAGGLLTGQDLFHTGGAEQYCAGAADPEIVELSGCGKNSEQGCRIVQPQSAVRMAGDWFFLLGLSGKGAEQYHGVGACGHQQICDHIYVL